MEHPSTRTRNTSLFQGCLGEVFAPVDVEGCGRGRESRRWQGRVV